MKKNMIKLASIALAGMMFFNLSITSYAYSDSYSSSTWKWAYEHIRWANMNGLAVGKADNRFDADGEVTRAEAATMLVKFKGIDVEQYDTPCEQFEDVGDKWYTKYINAAYANDVVTGKTDTLFDPEGELSRAEAAAMIVSAMGYEMETEAESAFADIEGGWYTDYINTAYAHEIVAGKGEGVFKPKENVSRAEMVTMIHAITYENFEMGIIDSLLFYFKSGMSKFDAGFVVTNASDQKLTYSMEDGFGGELSSTMETDGSCVGLQIYMQGSDSFCVETENKLIHGVVFCGSNADVLIEGVNIEKLQVNKDGTICIYGTDMEYSILLINQAHSLEYSDTDADDVVLKVVDGQFVEITE